MVGGGLEGWFESSPKESFGPALVCERARLGPIMLSVFSKGVLQTNLHISRNSWNGLGRQLRSQATVDIASFGIVSVLNNLRGNYFYSAFNLFQRLANNFRQAFHFVKILSPERIIG